MKTPYLFWITGMSGTGKTTFAKALQYKFNQLNIPNILIDGDVIREVISNENQLYDRESRLKLSYKYSKLCAFLVGQNINVICSTISLFHEIQDWNRKNIRGYYEVFVKRDLDKIIAEDNKDIYKKALEGKIKNVVGIDIEPEFPKNPELILDDIGKNDVDRYIEMIVRELNFVV